MIFAITSTTSIIISSAAAAAAAKILQWCSKTSIAASIPHHPHSKATSMNIGHKNLDYY